MTPFISQQDVVRDHHGKLIPGAKVVVVDPTSTNEFNIYTYDSVHDTYIVAQNPFYLDNESRPSQTYFSDRLVQLNLYEYIGDFSDPMSDDDTENWRFIRNWLGSNKTERHIGDDTLHGLSELMDADPEVGSVYVVGYWNDHDCEGRTYCWDATSTATPDGGYIIASNNTDTGRWILQFDGEYLPSTYYGVYPGREANMNALLTYPAQIGTVKTAPGVYFKPGAYTASTVALTTEKKLLVDASTSFTRDYFECNWVNVVGEPDDPIVDFLVDDKSCPVHSSWYRDVRNFWRSGSDHLYIDKTNNNFYKNIDTTIQVSHATIYGQNRLAQTYGTNGRLKLTGCSFVGDSMFNNTDKITFEYTDFKDEWFSGYSSDIDFTSTVLVRGSSLNTLRLANFKNVIGYIKAITANGETTLDLGGRAINQSINLQTNQFTKLCNIYSSASITIGTGSSYDLKLENVHCNQFSFNGRYLTVDQSEINFPYEPNMSAIWAYRSKVSSSYKWTSKSCQSYFENCTVSISYETVTDNISDESFKTFKNCIIAQNCGFYVKRLQMYGCTLNNNSIKIYPYKTTADNVDTYHLYAMFENNDINTAYPIEFTKLKVDQYGQNQEDERVYDCMVNWTFIGNRFAGNDKGITCRYWQHRLGQSYNRVFIAQNTDQAIVYKGNVGNCPAETLRGVTITSNQTYTTQTVYIGESTFTYYKYSSAQRRVMPMASQLTAYSRGYAMSMVGDMGTLMKYYSWVNSPYDSLTYDMFIQSTWYLYHVDEDNPTENGDFFKMAISTFNDYLRIVQRGDGDHNQGIIGKVI